MMNFHFIQTHNQATNELSANKSNIINQNPQRKYKL